MAEGGGAIVLDEEMREAGERVGYGKGDENQPPFARDDGHEKNGPAGQRSGGMKDPRQRLAVRQNVHGPEFAEGLGLLHGRRF